MPSCLGALLAQSRVVRIGVYTTVNDVQLLCRQVEVTLYLLLHHARIADDRLELRTGEKPALGGQDISMIGIDQHAEPSKRATDARQLLQPLPVHTIAGAVDVATGNPLM